MYKFLGLIIHRNYTPITEHLSLFQRGWNEGSVASVKIFEQTPKEGVHEGTTRQRMQLIKSNTLRRISKLLTSISSPESLKFAFETTFRGFALHFAVPRNELQVSFQK